MAVKIKSKPVPSESIRYNDMVPDVFVQALLKFKRKYPDAVVAIFCRDPAVLDLLVIAGTLGRFKYPADTVAAFLEKHIGRDGPGLPRPVIEDLHRVIVLRPDELQRSVYSGWMERWGEYYPKAS